MKPSPNAVEAAAKKLRKLRLTSVEGRKEHQCETVASIFKKGLGGLYEPEAIDYMVKFAVKYYLEEASRENIKTSPNIPDTSPHN